MWTFRPQGVLETSPAAVPARTTVAGDALIDAVKEIRATQLGELELVKKAERNGRIVIDLAEHWRDVQSSPAMAVRKARYDQPIDQGKEK